MTFDCQADLIELARIHYADRRKREKHLPAALFGEPAWDILLDLFIAAGDDKQVFVSSACLAAHVPQTTALRRIQMLEDLGLVERQGDAGDNRRTIVRLTADGLGAMRAFFSASALANGAWARIMEGRAGGELASLGNGRCGN
ncbi:MAG: winged helix DNA-binding protein [Novosphingobium sp.]|nr:winged helix DNA-binding protein [Novosphingobium sp.]